MKTEKRIDWETLWDMRDRCEKCRILCARDSSNGDHCPIWQGLEDVGDLRAGILKIINDWEPRESGHMGIAFHLCQELRNLINEPGCSCDDHNKTPAAKPHDPDEYGKLMDRIRVDKETDTIQTPDDAHEGGMKKEFLQHNFQHDPQPEMEKARIQTPDDADVYRDGGEE